MAHPAWLPWSKIGFNGQLDRRPVGSVYGFHAPVSINQSVLKILWTQIDTSPSALAFEEVHRQQRIVQVSPVRVQHLPDFRLVAWNVVHFETHTDFDATRVALFQLVSMNEVGFQVPQSHPTTFFRSRIDEARGQRRMLRE